jgi:ligand-binding sensor domain-containing protein/signal transduction histidine kinase/DNA-binding response OmpR family regulator
MRAVRILRKALLTVFRCGDPKVLMLLFCLLLISEVSRSEGIEAVNNLSFDFYSQEHGLSSNQIHSILQDKKGWMWFGTSQGACRFDGYKFTVFKNDPEDSTSLKGNLVRAIYEDHKGQLWIGTENGGLNKFNREKENFQHLFSSGKQAVLRDISVTSILEDQSGNLWVGTETCLYLIKNENTLTEIKPSNLPAFSDYFRVLRSDRSGRIWIGTNHGLYVYNPKTNSSERVNFPQGLSANKEIWDILLDDDGTAWVGTYDNGVFSVNQTTLEARQVILDPNNERSNTVRSISKDKNGKYWIGTRGGLYIYEKHQGVTAFYYHEEREPKSLVNNSIQCIVHDLKGDVWIGTRNGINFLIEERQNIHGFKSMPGDNRYLNSSEIYAFWVDPKGDIWAGTESGGINILNRETGRFRYLLPQRGNPNSLSSNCIKALLDDGNNNLWIGTFLGGLDVLNLRTESFKHYKNNPSDPGSLSDNRVWSLLKDSNNDIWVGTSSGLDQFDPLTGKFKHFANLTEGQVNWLAEDDDHCLWIGSDYLVVYNPKDQSIVRVDQTTRDMLQDSRKRFWLATNNQGIALYAKGKGIVKYYSEKNGLANNQALSILEDDDHFLWISTTNGLSKFDPEKERFHNFSIQNGFQNNQFTYGAALKTKNGELLFGGISGFNVFDPAKIKSGDYFAPIVLTDLKIFNKSVKIGNRKKDVLTKSISETEKIKLKYDQNSITLDFASFDYANNLGIQYSYYLEGFDKDWTEPSVNRSATYTNLDPGEYTFRVKTVSIDRQESNPGPILTVVILPPYWQTWWFRLLLFVMIAGLFYMLISFLVNKEKLKNDLVLERLKAKKLHELDMMKLRFYTNISHEIRTPLTLILGPLEKMKNNLLPPSEIKGHVELMYRNATQLHQLINQLLDFRKLESGNLKLVLTPGDLVAYISEIVSSFDKFAEEKEIELKFNSLKKKLFTNFDTDKVAKIMNNLLSNAFKFTGKSGKISVNLSLVFDSAENDLVGNSEEKRLIEITVKDTGIGISESNLEKIFTRFFQVGDGATQSGTGIGLALTKELVKLHNGKLFVASKPGKGSKFTVQLPYEELDFSESAEHASSVDQKEKEKIVSAPEERLDDQIVAGQKIMLLVDDNADVRYFIKSHFAASYQVLEAGSGIEGWDIALKTIPDIIISDVMMPDMDGFEFCRKIRKDERTSHIPILLLTALGSREHEREGLSYGADDYITKPFDLVVLQTKVENILSVRQSLKQKYTGEILLQPRNVILNSPDERFLQKAIEVIENNISDPDLDIERFSSEIGVSRMQLYRKLDALTEMTVKEFVRNIRLKRAAQMLVQKKLNVSEVAYAVGFRDLSHFRKCFKQEFGMSASEYVDKHGVE